MRGNRGAHLDSGGRVLEDFVFEDRQVQPCAEERSGMMWG